MSDANLDPGSPPNPAQTYRASPLVRPQFVRVAEKSRQPVRIIVNGENVLAFEGDTVLVAILTTRGSLRRSEFDDGDRAGFCLMGACQDCWVWTSNGERLRSCTTVVADGLSLTTRLQSDRWPEPA
jgi:D-hydroxyproline dehydrogenase subunit gamma